MTETPPRPAPWLIAAWPGMGNVAVIAAGYLVRMLNMKQLGELPGREHFDIAEVEVKDGLVQPVQYPRGVFFRWANTKGGRDLVVFLGEAQPTAGVYRYAQELMEAAAGMGVERVVTFASMASALHPAKDPKVSGVATDPVILEELRRVEVSAVSEGQIGGLNGLVLATAIERGLSGFCLMAEIPFFAAGVPNPKAARAALSVFTIMTGIDVSLDELNKHAEAVDRALIEAFERMNANRDDDEDETEAEEAGPFPAGTTDQPAAEPPATPPASAPSPEGPPEPAPAPKLDPAARRRIEELFEAARKSRGAAIALKKELDKLGVFKEFENRFLDLFRRAD
ncbi:MAG: hypothetical protein GIKADHBN_03623 [Phycisphaerales bacterium]|nr:hypothetical protein [Phycisphaerales bacterium]MCK6475621.1 PAC2 family protein [Phycisphaerales bacterium]